MRLLHEIAIFQTVKSKVIISLFDTVRLSVSISLRNLYNSLNSIKEILIAAVLLLIRQIILWSVPFAFQSLICKIFQFDSWITTIISVIVPNSNQQTNGFNKLSKHGYQNVHNQIWSWNHHRRTSLTSSLIMIFLGLPKVILEKDQRFSYHNYAPPPKIRWGYWGAYWFRCGSRWCWRPCRVSVGVVVGVGVTNSCTRDISWTSWWNSTNFAWIYYCGKLKSWLAFSDLELVFKVTGGFKWQILVPKISHEPVDGIPQNLPSYIIWASLRADYVLLTLTSFSRFSERFRYMKFSLKMRYLMSHCLDCHQTCKGIL